jgi:hypothetical protein
MLFAILPFISGITWLFSIPAIVLGIIGLSLKKSTKKIPLLALILGSLSWIISIFVFTASVGSSIEEESNSNSSSSEQTEESVEEENALPKIGEQAVNEYGVEFTVNSLQCGITSLPGLFGSEEQALGQFCVVSYTILNGSKDEISLSPDNVVGISNETEYKSSGDWQLGGLGPDKSFFTSINPGLGIDGETVLDIPKDVVLQEISFNPSWAWSSPIYISTE